MREAPSAYILLDVPTMAEVPPQHRDPALPGGEGAATPDPERDAPPSGPTTTGVPHFPPPAPSLPLGLPYGPPPTDASVGALPLPEERRSPFRTLGRFARELAETVILALLIFLLVRAVVQNFQVEGRSMEPTLHTQWYLLVNKGLYWEINLETVSKFVPFVEPGDDPTRYLFRGPKRGDVIVLKDPEGIRGEPERDFIKRIIALPGEVVTTHDGAVYIDGKPLDEPYINERPGYTCPPQRVPPGHYYVLGDNRNNSSDSHGSLGMVPKDDIIGKAWLIYWPLSEFGFVDGTSVEPDATRQEAVPAEVPVGGVGIDCNAAAGTAVP